MTKPVTAAINYTAPMRVRPRYHANDTSRDAIDLAPTRVALIDGRTSPPSLDREGFELVEHKSAVDDFRSADNLPLYRQEIRDLVRTVSGADMVVVNSPGILRFGEKSADSGRLNNSRPARFVHIDINDETAAKFSSAASPPNTRVERSVHYNIWRAITPPPQDVPLALCDARSIAAEDLIEADAVFDEPGKPEWSFTGLVVGASPRHRWFWFPDMSRDEAIVFVTNDSDAARPHCVPHSAFDNPLCPPEAPPRASIEMRAVAYWLA